MKVQRVLISMIVVFLNRGYVDAIFSFIVDLHWANFSNKINSVKSTYPKMKIPSFFGYSEHDTDVVDSRHFDCNYSGSWLSYRFIKNQIGAFRSIYLVGAISHIEKLTIKSDGSMPTSPFCSSELF